MIDEPHYVPMPAVTRQQLQFITDGLAMITPETDAASKEAHRLWQLFDTYLASVISTEKRP